MARTDHSRLHIYLSAEEYQTVREIAESQGLSMSAWVRSVILERARAVRGDAVGILRAGEEFEADTTYDAGTGRTKRTKQAQAREIDVAGEVEE